MLETPMNIAGLIELIDGKDNQYEHIDNNGKKTNNKVFITKNLRSFFQNQSSIASMTPDHMKKLIIDKVFENYCEAFEGISPAHYLVNNTELLKMYLKSVPKDLNFKDDKGATPISFAVAAGRLESVKHLKKIGADLNIKDNKGKIIAHSLVEYHNPKNNRDLTEIAKEISKSTVWLFHEKSFFEEQSALDICLVQKNKDKCASIVNIITQAQLNETYASGKLMASILVTLTNTFLCSNTLGLIYTVSAGALPQMYNALKLNKSAITYMFGQEYLPTVISGVTLIAAAYLNSTRENGNMVSLIAYNIGALATAFIVTGIFSYCHLKSALSEESFQAIQDTASKLFKARFSKENFEFATLRQQGCRI